MTAFALAALLAGPAAAADFDPAAYFATSCAMCHGATGHGDGPAAAALEPRPANFADPSFWKVRNDDIVKKVIREGGAAVGRSPIMAGYGAGLTDDELAALVAYLRAIPGKKS